MQTAADVTGGTRSTSRAQFGVIAAAISLFSLASAYCAARSQGFVAGDDCVHYFAARFAFAHPINFVDVWNRPLATALYSTPAWFGGRIAARWTSLIVALGCGLVSWRIAAGQRIRLSSLALIFTLGQPILFIHSFAVMTELPFALLFGLAFLAWQKKRFLIMAILIAFCPLARPEGFGIAALALFALALHGKWPLVLIPIPVLLWDIAGWLLSDRSGRWWRWLPDNWPYSATSLYGHGSALVFVAMLPAIVSPLIVPATLLGIGLALRAIVVRPRESAKEDKNPDASSFAAPADKSADPLSPRSESSDKHLRLCFALTAALPLCVVAAHSYLYWAGKMGSDGEARYLLVVAPLWGVLSARGWEWLFNTLRWRHAISWAAAGVILPVSLINAFHPVVPIHFEHDWISAKQMVDWYQASSLRHDHPILLASHPGVYYFLGFTSDANRGFPGWSKLTVRQRPSGVILIWDPVYASRNAAAAQAVTLDEIREAGWKEISAPSPREDDLHTVATPPIPPGDARRSWHVFISDGDL